MTEKSNPKLEAALLYLSLGWSVIPIHSIHNRKCTCGNPDCGHSSGKHPYIKWAEFEKRIATEDEIRGWWLKWPNANPGMATGAISGRIVLDVDEPRGVDTLRERRLAVPPGVRQQTGGGGYQYIFKHPGFECRNFAGKVGHTILPNIDFRGDGGLVVLPPGDHLSGGVYEWIVSPKDDQIKDAPDWLLDLIKGQMSATGNQGPNGQGTGLTPADWHREVPEGQRNTELTRIAGSLLYKMSSADAWPMISAWNQEHCKPPIDDKDLEKIIKSIANKESRKPDRKKGLQGQRTGKQATSEQAIQKVENDESWKTEVDKLKANPDPVEAGMQVKYFVITKLLHYDEMTVNRIVKGPLKKEFSLDADEIKGILKAWKEEKAQKQAESKKLKNDEEESDKFLKNPVFEKNGQIWKKKCKEVFGVKVYEDIQITSFTIKPIESITVEGKETLKVNIKSESKIFKEVLLPPECWTSIKNFTSILPAKETIFTGTANDVQYIRLYISTFKMPEKKGIRTAGFHDGKFITEEGALSPKGISKDTIYFNEVPTNCTLLSVKPATNDDLSKIKNHIDTFNTPTVSLPILGWMAACFFKIALSGTLKKMGLGNGFPLLNIQGEAGSGKTQSAEAVIMRLWAIRGEPKSIGELTKFTMMKMVDGSNTIPVILDENKSGMQTEYFKNLVSNLIRSTYNCLEGERGRADQTTQVYRYQAPVVIVGETGFTEGALLDRFVTVFLSKKDSAPYLTNFKELRKQPLKKLGRVILEKALRMGKEEIECILEDELGNVDTELADRPRVNAAIMRFGLRILGDILNVNFDLSRIDEAIKEGIKESDSIHRKSAVDKILEAMCLMSEFQEEARNEKRYSYQDHLEKDVDYDVVYDGIPVLRLYIHGSYPKFLKWAKAYRFEGDLLPESTFRKQLQKEPYYIRNNKTVRMGQITKKVFEINVDKMTEKGLELTDYWSLEDQNTPF